MHRPELGLTSKPVRLQRCNRCHLSRRKRRALAILASVCVALLQLNTAECPAQGNDAGRMAGTIAAVATIALARH